MVRNLPAAAGDKRSLGQGDMATRSSILAWKIPVDGGAWWATVHGIAKRQTRLSQTHDIHRSTVLFHLAMMFREPACGLALFHRCVVFHPGKALWLILQAPLMNF